MLKYLVIVATCAVTSSIFAQDLSGKVVDATNGERIPFASIYIINSEIGVIADSVGGFVFTSSLPERFDVKVSAQLYETVVVQATRGEELMVKLEHSHQDLEDVIVSTPGGGFGDENAFHVDQLKISELNAIQSSTLGEAISNVNGVQESSTGPGISKPVIRGLQGVRVLTMVNGVRMESQQWGGDHGFAITELGIGSVEVIKGPSSLLFGNDAFGGVIFLQDEPYSVQNTHTIDVNSRFETASIGTTSSMLYRAAKGNFRVSVGGLYTNHADYVLPSGHYLQDSRFKQIGGKFNLGYSKNNWVSHFRYTFGQGRVGIPGHSHDSIPEPSDFWLTTQSRSNNIPAQVIGMHIASWENKFFFKKNEINILVSNANNNLMEFEEKHTIPGLGVKLNSSYLKAGGVFELSDTWKLMPGIQSIYQVNTNDKSAEEQLIPDYNQFDQGVYALMSRKKDDWTIQFGGRVDLRILNASEENFSGSYVSPNFSAGLVNAGEGATIHFNVSSATRIPHVSELFSDGVHHGSLRYEIGDENLVREQAYQADLNVEIHGEHLEFIINPYYNLINNFISITPMDSLIEGYDAFSYIQTDQVNLFGADAGMHYHPHFAHWLHLESSYSYVRAHDNPGNSLALIPQARINSYLKIAPEMKGKFKIENVTLQHQFYFEQTKVAFDETSSPSFNLLNASVNCLWDLKTPLRISAGVKNALNEEYVNHLSRLKNINTPNVGRNVYISLKYNIKSKINK
jgi:iron complex outermembrane receptor protein